MSETYADSGSYTPQSLELRRRLAEAMLTQGMQTGPIGSPWQGAARLVQAMMGGYQLNKLSEDEKKQTQAGNEALLSLLGGSDQTSALPSVPTASPVSEQPAGDLTAAASAISSNESGGNYQALGPVITRKDGTTDRAYGKYQVMGENIPSWTKEVLGAAMTPEQFLASPQSQDAVFKGKFGQYVQKTGNLQDAASMWFTGKPLAEGANLKDVLGTTGSRYVEKFTRGLNQAAGITPTNASGAASQPSPSAAPAGAAGILGLSLTQDQKRMFAAALNNPASRTQAMQILSVLVNRAEQAPQIHEIELPGQYPGTKVKVPVVFNPQTHRYERFQLSAGMEPQAATAVPTAGSLQPALPSPLQPSPGAMPQPQPMQVTTELPAAMQPSPELGGMQAVAREGKQDLLSPAMLASWEAAGGVQPTTAPAAAQATPAPPQAPAQAAVGLSQPTMASAQSTVPAGYREVPVDTTQLPKPQEGYTYDLGPTGKPLLSLDGANYKMVPLAEVTTRAKLEEARGQKLIDAQESVGGLHQIIKGARELTDAPGFEKGLMLHRMSLNIGLNAGPLGNIGGDVLSPGKQIAKMLDPQNPAWSAADAITQVQSELGLTAGRAFLKGQGQVSNFERQMVADAIGSISGATSKADYQFRLNAAQKMIDDVNSGVKISEHQDRYNVRPTISEIKPTIYQEKGILNNEEVVKLADRYNVNPIDMQEYINNLYLNQPQSSGSLSKSVVGSLSRALGQ